MNYLTLAEGFLSAKPFWEDWGRFASPEAVAILGTLIALGRLWLSAKPVMEKLIETVKIAIDKWPVIAANMTVPSETPQQSVMQAPPAAFQPFPLANPMLGSWQQPVQQPQQPQPSAPPPEEPKPAEPDLSIDGQMKHASEMHHKFKAAGDETAAKLWGTMWNQLKKQKDAQQSAA